MAEKLGAHGQMRDFDESNGQYLPENNAHSKEVDNLKNKSVKELKDLSIKKPLNNKKLTSDEKISKSKIDFSKDNILAELNEEDLKEIGCEENKNVLLKKNIIDRNFLRHYDLSEEESEQIILQALYSNKKQIFPSKHADKPNYFTFAQVVRISKEDGKDVFGTVLLDVDKRKESFEVVHWLFVHADKLKSLK